MKIHYTTFKTEADATAAGWTPARVCAQSGRCLAWQPRADRLPPLRRMIANPQGEPTVGPLDPDNED